MTIRLATILGVLCLVPATLAQTSTPTSTHTAAEAAGAGPAPTPTCIACHGDAARVPDERLRKPVTQLARDVHHLRGLSCHDCHGGDAFVDVAAPDAVARAHAPEADFHPPPAPADLPAFCGRCHSDAEYMGGFSPGGRVDQEAQYHTSVHGQKLVQGDTSVAQCLSCHGQLPGVPGAEPTAHGIRAVSDPNSPVFPTNVSHTCGRCHADAVRMKPYGIPTDQFALYEKSVHRHQLVENEDLSAPTCNDCHGNHGARPPHVDSLANVCGSCHARQAELFRDSSMRAAFDFMELGECTVCHGNHDIERPDDEMLVAAAHAPSEGAMACSECHEGAEDVGLVQSARMHTAITGLDAALAETRATVKEAAEKGMPVSEAEYVLTGATDALVEARVLIHGWTADPVLEATERGGKAADEAATLGHQAIADYFFRHRWLGASLLGIAVVILSLWLKMRQLDRRWEASLPVRDP